MEYTIKAVDGWTFTTDKLLLVEIYTELEDYNLTRNTKVDLAGVVFSVMLDRPLYGRYTDAASLVYELAGGLTYRFIDGLTDEEKIKAYYELNDFIDLSTGATSTEE